MITKNVNIRETWYGFAVYNNGTDGHHFPTDADTR